MRVFLHGNVAGYPHDPDLVASVQGFGRNAYIPTEQPIVVVAGAGPGSGKIETALQQIWHDCEAGRVSGFAKWETFPVWDLPLEHPLNMAYEAATADLQDVNMIDPFHLEAYGVEVTNYNRDVEHFAVLQALLGRILAAGGELPTYRSPTDMCVNRVSHGIVDDAVVREASCQEIIRRFLRYRWERTVGAEREATVERARGLMEAVGMTVEDRPSVPPARRAAQQAESEPGKGYRGTFCGAALETPDGELVSGKNSAMVYSTTAAVINTVKRLAGVQDDLQLLTPTAIQHLVRLKNDLLGQSSECLDISEALTALSISASYNPAAQRCFEKLPALRQCDMHMTHLPSDSDQRVLRQLGIMFTTDARLTPGDRLFR